MTRLMIILAGSAAVAAGVATVPTAALAQGGGQLEVAVFGNDPCPRSTESRIVVCKRYPESQRYRLPKSQNPQGTLQQRQSWENRSRPLLTVGNTGAMTCSPVGPGGYTGCLTQEINQAKRDSREQEQQDAAPQK